jgi:hypothetical protein
MVMHMSRRIHVVLEDRELEGFRARASAEGRSLSDWLRNAARESLERDRPPRLSSVDDLADFFRACDKRESGREPDWTEHMTVAARSRGQGVELT